MNVCRDLIPLIASFIEDIETYRNFICTCREILNLHKTKKIKEPCRKIITRVYMTTYNAKKFCEYLNNKSNVKHQYGDIVTLCHESVGGIYNSKHFEPLNLVSNKLSIPSIYARYFLQRPECLLECPHITLEIDLDNLSKNFKIENITKAKLSNGNARIISFNFMAADRKYVFYLYIRCNQIAYLESMNQEELERYTKSLLTGIYPANIGEIKEQEFRHFPRSFFPS